MTALAFVTGCLEPQRDGIGDYCRVLASALAEAGARPALLALTDRAESAGGAEPFPCLRLPASRPWSERVEAARSFLAQHAPDGLCLQLSPYLYDRRGLLQRQSGPLRAILQGWRPQIVVHETWVGTLPYHSWKDRLIGPWQRRGMIGLLRALEPAKVYTAPPLYRDQFASQGVAAEILPLPGNIPVSAAPPGPWLAERFAAEGLALGEPGLAVAGMFGGHWPHWNPEAALDAFCKVSGEAAVLLLIGRHGATAERLAVWRQRYPSLHIVESGLRSGAEISQCLNAISFAIAVSPWELVSKSGTVAALLEHGVPVLTTWGDSSLESGVPPDRADLLFPPGSDPAPLLQRRPGSGPFRPLAPSIAVRLLGGFAKASPKV